MSGRSRTIWAFVITSLALFMGSLANLVVTTALPVIRVQLHASLSSLEWTVNAYTLSFAVLLLTGATLGERFGRRRMLIVGLAIFTLGSAAAAISPDTTALILARMVQGMGAAIVTPLTLTILSAAVPAERRGRGGRYGHRARAGRRRGDRPGDLVEVDLLAERADRDPPDPARPAAAGRDPRAGQGVRRARPRAREPGALRGGARTRAGQRRRMDLEPGRALDRRRGPAAGGLRGLGAAGPCPHAPDGAVRIPRFQRGQRGQLL